ncbi:MAG: alpha-L-fucosidase, partial [Prevotella sp.]
MRHLITFILFLFSAQTVGAQGDVYERSKTYEWPDDPLIVNKLHQWQDLKFGVLMHWGLYSVPGIVESWSICDEDWITRDTTRTYQQYKDWYWGLCEKFN